MGISDIIRQGQDKEAMLKRSLDTLVKLYSDKIHFIYELLQNAEDTRANSICFRQYADRLEVLHNGYPFTKSNLQSLCDAALSDKTTEKGMIGKFGLGFKSVFTICNVVKLYSEPSNNPLSNALESFAVKIKNYIDPTDIDNKWNHENFYTTKFIFPYYVWDEFYKTADELKKSIARKLRDLGANVLLFLKNIKKIEYVIHEIGKDFDGEGAYELERKQINTNFSKVRQASQINENDVSWFVFSKSIDNTERSVDIVFSVIEENDNVKFVKSNLTNISVYFPTEIESHLNFIVQAPFDLTPNRSSLIKDSKCNDDLFLLLDELLKEAVYTFKDENILSLELISLLPYKTIDNLKRLPSKAMDNLRDGMLIKKHLNLSTADIDITDMLKTEAIIPAIDGKYIAAKDAKIVYGAKLLELFEGNILCKLINQPSAKWLSGDFTKDNQQLGELHSFFIRELKIEEIGSDDLARLIKNNPDFLKKKVDDEWLIEFYSYLTDPKNRLRSLLGKDGDLATIPFIKTDDGNFNPPFLETKKPNIFLRPKGTISDDIKGFLFIDDYIAQKCPSIIEEFEIKKPDILQYFIHELENGRDTQPNDETNISQIKKAIQFIISDAEKAIDPFKNLLWIKVINTYGKTKFITCSNETIYREKDFCGVSIKEYFGDVNCNIYILDEQFYLENGLVLNDLEILEKLGILNSVYRYLSQIHWKEGNAECCDIDDFRKNLNFYYLEEVFEYIIKYSTIKTTEEKSEKIKFAYKKMKAKQKSDIILKLLKNVEKHLQGVWKYSKTNPERKEGVSNVVECLKSRKWLFDKNGSIVSPSEISRYDLDTDIYGKVDEKSNIYEILGFMKTEQDKQSEVVQKIFSLLKQFNIPVSSNNLKQIALIIQNSIYEEAADFNPENKNNNDPFSNQPIKNLQRLQEWIKKQYDEASETEYEYLQRHIRTSRRKNSERKNIGQRYHGYCQICHKRRLYWDIAEIFEKPKKELEQMNLSLCLNCAHEYRQLRRDDELMFSFRTNILGKNPEKDTVVMLGEKRVKFTNTHLAEIQEILKIEEE